METNKSAPPPHSNEDRLIQSHVLSLRSLINCLCVEAKFCFRQALVSFFCLASFPR